MLSYRLPATQRRTLLRQRLWKTTKQLSCGEVTAKFFVFFFWFNFFYTCCQKGGKRDLFFRWFWSLRWWSYRAHRPKHTPTRICCLHKSLIFISPFCGLFTVAFINFASTASTHKQKHFSFLHFSINLKVVS